MANTTATAPSTRGSQAWPATVGVLVSVAGSLLGTWVTSELDGSPELKLAGAVLGALIPAVLAALFKDGTRPAVALLVALVAIALTYVSFTAAAYVMERPATFPLPAGAPSPTGTVTDGDEGGLAIEVTPAMLTCTADGCAEQVTVTNAGVLPLRIDAIEVEGDETGSFRLDPADTCAFRTLPAPGDSCSFDVGYTPPGDGGTVTATLVIHQNLPLVPSYVPLLGDAGGGEECVLPDVVGLTLDAAEPVLLARCASRITVEQVESDASVGTVLSTDPAGGTEAGLGEEVVVRVSAGTVESGLLTIPDVGGRSAAQALGLLGAEGFTDVRVVDASGDEADPDQATAVGTVPSAGSTAEPDEPILLVVDPDEAA